MVRGRGLNKSPQNQRYALTDEAQIEVPKLISCRNKGVAEQVLQGGLLFRYASSGPPDFCPGMTSRSMPTRNHFGELLSIAERSMIGARTSMLRKDDAWQDDAEVLPVPGRAQAMELRHLRSWAHTLVYSVRLLPPSSPRSTLHRP